MGQEPPLGARRLQSMVWLAEETGGTLGLISCGCFCSPVFLEPIASFLVGLFWVGFLFWSLGFVQVGAGIVY